MEEKKTSKFIVIPEFEYEFSFTKLNEVFGACAHVPVRVDPKWRIQSLHCLNNGIVFTD